MKRRSALALLVLLGLTAVAVAGITPAAADVTPAEFSATLAPGESATVTKTVTLPEVTPRLDLVLDVDLSGSYSDDLPVIKSLAPGIYDDVTAAVPDSMFGLVTFVDYPFFPWGSGAWGDYAYARNQDLTTDKTTWTGAINAMATRNGVDEPESQLESVYQAATGAGRDVPPAGPSPGDVPAGEGISWRADATKVIALTTDASMHVADDSSCTSPAPPCPFLYPGPSFAEAVTALNDAGIVVIAIKAPGSTTQMDDLAAATGGVVKTTGSSSAEIADAIVDALQELTFTVTGSAVGCDPLEITFDPASHTGVSGGESVAFEETITVPDGTAPGTYTCTVEFKAGDAVVGIQTITITVVPAPPATLTLEPKTDTNPVDTEHCVTATVKDAAGNPTPGVTVRFTVTGSVNTSGSATTDADGEAEFCYNGPALPGTDAISAYADTDNDDTQDPGEPGDTAEKTWVLPASTPGCKVTYGGWIIAANGDRATFGGVAMAPVGSGPSPRGQQQYTDHGPVQPLNVHSKNVLVLTCTDTEASIFGDARVNGSTATYRIDLKDLATPGSGGDTYRIRLGTGYDSGEQTLKGGNVVIH